MPLSFNQLQNLFIAGPNINIYPSGNTYAISGSGGSGNTGTIISGTNRGTGIGVFQGLQTTTNPNDTLGFYNLLEGDNVGIVINDDDEIVINRGRIVVNTVSNQGGGAKVYTGITGTTLLARTISGAAGFTSALFNSPTTGASSAITANTLVRIAPTNTTLDRFYTITTGPILTAITSILPSAATGNVGIGLALVATSRLLVASGTSAISQIRLTPFSTEPTSPSDGSIWFSTSGDTLKLERGNNPSNFIFKDNNIDFSGYQNLLLVDSGGTITPSYINSFGKFSSLSSVTLTDATTETSIISSQIIGSTTLLASTNQYNPELVSGKKYRFNAKGNLVTNDFTNLTLKIKLGSTVIGLVNNYSLSDAIDGYFEIDYTFTFRSSGSSGIVFGSGKILPDTPLNPIELLNTYPIGIYTNTTTINTTSDKIFDCTVEFDVAASILTINESSLETLT
jgi:hypothetical protein